VGKSSSSAGFGIDTGVWERSGEDTMPRSIYMALFGILTMAGLAITAASSYLTLDWVQLNAETGQMDWIGPNPWLVFIGGLVVTLIGVVVAIASSNPVIKLGAYFGLLAFPFGLLLGPTVAMYTEASVAKVVFITFCVTGVTSFIGAIVPKSLESWGSILFGFLTILLVGIFAVPLMGYLFPSFPLKGALTLMDWFGVILFSAYVIYDVNRAMWIPATVNNAIDAAVSLYLDVLNLFVRLLELYGKAKGSD
jgi:FtsH-binding integral membrane protein